ncbi:MAG: hypothetical protein HN884_00790 [Rhodospirillaceae bacterium]|jgi:hypothetical protein|nr:hypothetical protein [Rhodospirillaceae bacterium]MBT7265383.1 hypothetical protein [Rhodospirillaceae bacterium]
MIDPQISLPSLPDTSETAEALIATGNYAYAFHKAEDPVTRASAQIMCGAIGGGLAILDDALELSDEARLIQAYGHWCLGVPERALEILKGVKGDQARQFEKIVTEGAAVLICAEPTAERLESFDNIKLTYQSIEPDHYGETISFEFPIPDLIVGFNVSGINLPSNIFDLECPTAFWVGDHDFFYATRQADFSRATILVANSAGEHVELSEHYQARVVSFPGHETYSKGNEFPNFPDSKNIDIGYTGRAFVPYMRDKAQFLFQLATIDDPDLKISICDGYLAEEAFVERMRESKFVPLFWRYGGGIQTRAIDALRQGAFVLSPEALTSGELLGGDGAGFVSICDEHPAELAEQQLAGFDERLALYRENESQIDGQFKDLFWPEPARGQRFIKFCLFQSILAGLQQTSSDTTLPLPAELRGYNPSEAIDVYTAIAKHNMAAAEKSVAHYNFAAAAAFYAATVGDGNEELAHYALDIYALGQEACPANMVLKFNAARVLWTFGARPEASVLFGELARSDKSLEFDPKDALLSHRMRHLADMFNYGDYLQAALSDPNLAQTMIQSCALTYLGVLAFDTDQAVEARAFFEKAITLSAVNFPAYQHLAKVLDHLSAGATDILGAFYQAVNLYPPILRELLSIGVAAELANGQQDRAAFLLNQGVLYHHRVCDAEGHALPLDGRSAATIKENRHLLKDWIGEAFDQMQ